jgi:hypothetical protein
MKLKGFIKRAMSGWGVLIRRTVEEIASGKCRKPNR